MVFQEERFSMSKRKKKVKIDLAAKSRISKNMAEIYEQFCKLVEVSVSQEPWIAASEAREAVEKGVTVRELRLIKAGIVA